MAFDIVSLIASRSTTTCWAVFLHIETAIYVCGRLCSSMHGGKTTSYPSFHPETQSLGSMRIICCHRRVRLSEKGEDKGKTHDKSWSGSVARSC